MPEAIEVIQENVLFNTLLLLLILVASLRAIDLIFDRAIPKQAKSKLSAIHMNFFKSCLKAIVFLSIVAMIGGQFEGVRKFYSSILLSSSLLIVVLGFILQEGLANIVHGLIITIFKPFELGDRITVTVDGVAITGYVEMINVGHTVIKNVLNQARVIIPNSKMDTAVIENSYYEAKKESSNFIDITVSFESDLPLACEIMAEEVVNHPLFNHKDPGKDPQEITPVFAKSIDLTGVCLRISVTTNTIEENFTACSDIRKNIVRRIQETPGVAFAYQRVQVREVPIVRKAIDAREVNHSALHRTFGRHSDTD